MIFSKKKTQKNITAGLTRYQRADQNR